MLLWMVIFVEPLLVKKKFIGHIIYYDMIIWCNCENQKYLWWDDDKTKHSWVGYNDRFVPYHTVDWPFLCANQWPGAYCQTKHTINKYFFYRFLVLCISFTVVMRKGYKSSRTTDSWSYQENTCQWHISVR